MDKRREKVTCKDRISGLPRNLIDCILERMLVHDAARTSVLSRNRRYIWAAHPQLVFDKQFFEDAVTNKRFCKFFDKEFNITYIKLYGNYIYENLINRILFVHIGPILKFVLYIPNNHYVLRLEMDQWILVLSRKGIKELTIENSSPAPYKLPSYIFSCLELTYMEISNCILSPPVTFEGFGCLISLSLVNVSFSAKILGTVLPNAKRLSFSNCTGMKYIKIRGPKLHWLDVVNSHEFDWECFKSSQNIKEVDVSLCKVYNANKGRTINLIQFLYFVSNIEKLCLDGFSLKFLAAGTIPKRLPTSSNHLIELRLFKFRFNDLNQISCALCLLRSSTNLQNLEIEVSAVTHGAMEPVLNYLEAPNCMDMSLDRLKKVTMRSIMSLKVQLLFIKLILAHSPSLERMIIDLSEISANEELKFSRELIRFSRASSRAEIVYLNNNKS